jgi:TIR domain
MKNAPGGPSKKAQKDLSKLSSITQMTVVMLQVANEVELSNAIDVANASQDSYKFILHPTVIKFRTSKYRLPNGAIDFEKAINDLVSQNTSIQKLLSHKPIFVTSLPFSDKNLVKEYRGKALLEELSQCYFYNVINTSKDNIPLISTFIWENLVPRPRLNLPKSPSGRRALQPFLLFEFASYVLDPLNTLFFHEETLGCPFDYCNKVQDIDEAFRERRICAEHEDFFQEQIERGQLTKRQLISGQNLFNRAFGIAAAKVFLCHSSEDKEKAQELYYQLRNDGFFPWLDEEDLKPGQNWKLEIEKAVRNCDVILICLSKQSVKKTGYVQKEIKEALDVAAEHPEQEIFLIPLKLEECDVPPELKKYQWVNLFDKAGYQRLRRALNLSAKAKNKI